MNTPSPATRKGVFCCLKASAITLFLFWLLLTFTDAQGAAGDGFVWPPAPDRTNAAR